jgi:thiamine pyrophosphate-dependent acetolactate synthase large subunit-like protein
VNGAELLVETLRTHGVKTVFSLSGNQILSVYDATIRRGIDLLHTRHEAAATHMADGWGRLTETPDVALVTAGPVHLSLPGDLLEPKLARSMEAPPPPRLESIRLPDAAVRRVLDLFAEAKRPLILLGPSMARARRRQVVDTLSEITGVPALVMESPRGVNDPALHAAAASLPEADVVLLLGKSLDYSVRLGQPPVFAAGARLARIDVDAVSSERFTLSAVADPVLAAGQLVEAARERAWQRSAWADEVTQARATMPPSFTTLARDTRLINGLSGSIGSAIPLALAAKVAHPDRTVVAVLGDGTFGFHAMEMDTAVRYCLPIVRWWATTRAGMPSISCSSSTTVRRAPSRASSCRRATSAWNAPRPSGRRARGRVGQARVREREIDGVAAPTYSTAPRGH